MTTEPVPAANAPNAPKIPLDARIVEQVRRQVPNLSVHNVRTLQAFTAHTKVGLMAAKIAQRTERLMRQAGARAVDRMGARGDNSFFARLEELSAKLRAQASRVTALQESISKAIGELDRELMAYDRILDEIKRLTRGGEQQPPAMKPATLTPAPATMPAQPTASPAPAAPSASPPDEAA